MDKNKEKNGSIFNRPWCPLFGMVSPLGLYPPASQSGRCLRIIRDAREIWDIYDLLKSEPLNPSWPEPGEVDYPRSLILAAREISRLVDGVDRDAGFRYSRETPWYERKDGTYALRNSIDTLPAEDVIDAVGKRARGKEREIIKKLPAYAIFAILAIEKAWFAFCWIEEDEELEDNSCI